jgi:16S rRNA processing protein RimM
MSPRNEKDLICVGVVAGVHGLKGAVKIKSFMENQEDILSFGPLFNRAFRDSYKITLVSKNKKGIVARLSGIEDRNAAEGIKGLELYVPRAVLPELNKDEFYYHDLIGLEVDDLEGNRIGKVIMVDNFGAGDIIEVSLDDVGTRMFTMSLKEMPIIDFDKGRIVVNPLLEIIGDEAHDNK